MRRTSAPRLRNVSRHAVDVVRCARCIWFHDGRAHGPSSRHETDMRHAASSVPGPSKSVGARQADESADVALCPRQARLRIDGELFVSWSTRNAALIAALVQRRRNALHGVEVIDAAAIVLLTRRRRRPVSSSTGFLLAFLRPRPCRARLARRRDHQGGRRDQSKG